MDSHPVHGPVHGPVDPDVTPEDVRTSEVDHAIVRDRLDVLAVIALGGAVGAAARYAAGQAWPSTPGEVPWATFAVNVIGSFLLGLLMVYVTDVWPPRRYVRPFLGVGVLGGFTTFSTYALDTRALLEEGRVGAAGVYVLATLVLAVGGVLVGAIVAQALTRTRVTVR
ncbi:fluoride efflux transporter CrcB [Intrasporangium sp.]|uniref:fluoride efflux transporter CrcB n=1 Tax=Intrasporangium sp. TaxID=1925024 RepID=UPI00293B27A5|nr:fluoride efflux transporter CrcB [Intrasporangium sp.]MDV3221818.1 fluoride efflux transporter CrcB [Intrasporangium sp.]